MTDNPAILSSVRDWLDRQGYPLEMRVAAALSAAGLSVIQSSYFRDASTEKWRELDVVAFRRWHTPHIQWQLTLIIECNVSKGQPWVLFTRPLDVSESKGQFQYYRTGASQLGRRLLSRLRRSTADTGDLPLLDFGERPGYGIQQAQLNASQENQEKRREDSRA